MIIMIAIQVALGFRLLNPLKYITKLLLCCHIVESFKFLQRRVGAAPT